MPDNRKPLIYGAFPVCRNYTVRAQLCLTAFGERCASEANPGVAGSQRYWHDGEYLQPFGLQVQDHLGKCDGQYPDLVPLYDEIYNKHNRSYFEALEVKAQKMAKKYDCAFVDNEMPFGRVPQGHPVIVDYFYHEEIRGTENTGKRNR